MIHIKQNGPSHRYLPKPDHSSANNHYPFSQHRKKRISRLVLLFYIATILSPIHAAAAVETSPVLPATHSASVLPALETPVKINAEAFTPTLLMGLNLYPENPLQIDFLVGKGDDFASNPAFQQESEKLVKYFLAALTTPKDEMWVNLSPYEADRIIPDDFGKTEMGRDLLVQDYLLKQLTASVMSPNEDVGATFWERIHAQLPAGAADDIHPTDVFNKIWIVPETATVYEHAHGAFIVESHLKVMTERDYLAKIKDKKMKGENGFEEKNPSSNFDLQSSIIKETIIPAIEKEVNDGPTFANLRQIFSSLILALWYKQRLSTSLLSNAYSDQHVTDGVDHKQDGINQTIYEKYVGAFKKGAFNVIKEDYDPVSQQLVARKYFSGGVATDQAQLTLTDFFPWMKMAERMSDIYKFTAQIGAPEKALTLAFDPEMHFTLNDIEKLQAIPEKDLTEDQKIKLGILLRQRDMITLMKKHCQPNPENALTANSLSWFDPLGILTPQLTPWSEYNALVKSNMDAIKDISSRGSALSLKMWKMSYGGMADLLIPGLTSSAEKLTREIAATDYLKSIRNNKPENYSPTELIDKYNDSFLLHVLPKKGQKIDNNLPAVLILAPYSGHHWQIVDYTNMNDTSSNSLAQAFMDAGFPTYIVGYALPQRNQDTSDLNGNIDRFKKKIGRKLLVYGACQGGALGAINASVSNGDIDTLLVAAGPVDTEQGGSNFKKLVKAIDENLLVYWFGNRSKGKDGQTVYSHSGRAQNYGFEHSGYEGGMFKRDPEKKEELIENIYSLKYLLRNKPFSAWFNTTLNIGMFVDWIRRVFKHNQFFNGTLLLRQGHKERIASADEAIKRIKRLVIIEAGGDDITPVALVNDDKLQDVIDVKDELWHFLTKGQVKNDDFSYKETFTRLIEKGYLNIITTRSPDDNGRYAYVNQEKLEATLGKIAKKNMAYAFDLDDFVKRGDFNHHNIDETKEIAHQRIANLVHAINTHRYGLNEPINIDHFFNGLDWLAKDISIYSLLPMEEIETFALPLLDDIEITLGSSIPEIFANDELLKKLAKTYEGIKLKRLISRTLFPEYTPKTPREADSLYEPDIHAEEIQILQQAINDRFFSDSDPRSVNSEKGVKAVMRQPFTSLAFRKDGNYEKAFEDFLNIDAPFIREVSKEKLKKAFDHLRKLRGQSSSMLDKVKGALRYVKWYIQDRCGHIGVYNSSKSLKNLRAVIIPSLIQDYKDAGQYNENAWQLNETNTNNKTAQPVDQAMMGNNSFTKGGIDLNTDFLDMNVEQESNVIIPFFPYPIQEFNVNSFQPQIINITPVQNIFPLLGLKENRPTNSTYPTNTQAALKQNDTGNPWYK